MTIFNAHRVARELVLRPCTAAELMTPNPLSVSRTATVAEAAAFLTRRGISAAPVIDEAGRPLGVVSRSDILARSPAAATCLAVHTAMTPAVFSVRPNTPSAEVVETMMGLGVRRLFVVDGGGVLVGVISAIDVLRKLCRRDSAAARPRHVFEHVD
jgi:CBS domain-containing protein